MANPFDSRDDALYGNSHSFLRLPMCRDPSNVDADMVILGFPLDLATTGRPGARLGPEAVRRSSVNLAWEDCKYPWKFNMQDQLNVLDAGDLVFPCGDAGAFCNNTESAAGLILENDLALLSLGGDHFITLPLLRAHAKKYGPMALIHFDAHTDTYSEGGKYDHGTMFYHAVNEGLIDVNNSIQVGIRTDYDRSGHGFEVIHAEQANELPIADITETIKSRVADKPVYLTFDIDCLDPAFAPGTGTPVVGGISSHIALGVIRGLAGINLVGMDVVEVSPPYDHSDITSLVAATIAIDLMHLWALQHKTTGE